MQLFGWNISRKRGNRDSAFGLPLPSIAAPITDDGAVNVTALPHYADQYVDIEGLSRQERDLITRYRDLSLHPELQTAVDEILNEILLFDKSKPLITINLDQLEIDPDFKQIINQEFQYILNLLNFRQNGYELIKRWYVDGRIYFYCIVDEKKPQLGIQELRYLDPRKIKYIREIDNVTDKLGRPIQAVKDEYFLYDDRLRSNGSVGPFYQDVSNKQVRIARNAIALCTSGLMDEQGEMVLSYLHQAIKPLNQLRMLEDSTIIYRLARSPERRIFYINVGNLPQHKAEQYLYNAMLRHKNRLVYDATTGNIRDDRKMTTMLEDYYFPVYGDGKTTRVETLPGGQNLGVIQDVEYFKERLSRSLNIPISRLNGNQPYTLGKQAEISRDEIKFQKFIERLRMRFSMLFLSCIEKQLTLKGLIDPIYWNQIKQYIVFDWNKDNFFIKLQKIGLLQEISLFLSNIEPFTQEYYSKHYIKTKILEMDENEITQMTQEIMIETEERIQKQAMLSMLEMQITGQGQP